jgi:hypothetical protein
MSYAALAGTARGQESRLFLTIWLRQVFRDPLTAYLVTCVQPASSSIVHITLTCNQRHKQAVRVKLLKVIYMGLRFKNNT